MKQKHTFSLQDGIIAWICLSFHIVFPVANAIVQFDEVGDMYTMIFNFLIQF